jgi:HPt (histidine-containing phosphotransfer) domain-containing protein
MEGTVQTCDGERPDVIIDLERLKTNCHGNLDIVAELVGHLLEKSQPKWTASLEEGIQAKDSEYLRETCHAMKGAAATVFAWRLSNLAADLGGYARDENFASCEQQLLSIRDAFIELDQWKTENL